MSGGLGHTQTCVLEESYANVGQVCQPNRHPEHWLEVSVAPYCLPATGCKANGPYRFYIVYVVWLAIETTIIWFLYPETKGPTLEELGRLFEDENPLAKGRLDLEKAHDYDGAMHVEEKPK